MNTNKPRFNTRTLAFIGLMAALVFVGNWLRFPIPIPYGNAAIHLGNVFCLLSALLLGGVGGGLSAGIGGFIFDLTYPGYASGAVFTLVFKFALAFVCGTIVYARGKKAENLAQNVIGAVAGSITYAVLYIGKGLIEQVYFLSVPLQTALVSAGTKTVTSLINAVIAIAISIPLYYAIKKALKSANVNLKG